MKTLRPGNSSPPPRWRGPTRPHGIAAILAMLYLVLFATLAIGFYTATTMSGQIARNEKALELSQAAADGGTQFMRYQLGLLTIAPTVPPSGLMDAVAQGLAQQLNGTANMNGHSVQNTNGVIYIPSATDWTTVDSNAGTKFRAMLSQSGQFVVVNVDGAGAGGNAMRAIQIQYQKAPKAGAILDYGVASRGTIATAGATYIQGLTDPTKGSVLSADMLSGTPIAINGKAVSGDLSTVNPAASVIVGPGVSIGGTNNPNQIPQHIHTGVPAPTFPWVDTSVFTAYATHPYVPGMTTLTDVYIPPNTNPKFTGGATINGVLWIQSPNVVTFKGNATVNGVIVTDTIGSFDGINNQINFGGNVQATPLSQLSTTNPAYDPNLVKLTGAFLLAPNYAVSMTGNFGTLGGSVVAGTMNMSGNATGTVRGSVITMYDAVGSNSVYLNGSADIFIDSTGTSNYPSGLSFGSNYTPLPGTYLEVAPW